MREESILVVHYPFHYPAVKWHPKVIVLSHGILWNRPPQNLTDRFFAYWAKRSRSSATTVANDTEYLREIGIGIKPATKEFDEVEDGVFYFPNCVDTTVFRRDPAAERQQRNQSSKVILVPRNIRPERGIHLALQAFGKIADALKGYTLRIVGNYSEDDYFGACLRVIDDYGIADRVELAGPKAHGDMLQEYHHADMTIIPSTDMEGTSLSALESMASGTPVLSTSVGGLKDLPTLKCNLDADDLARKIIDLTDAHDHYQDSQHDFVRSKFGITQWNNAWNDLVFSVAEK